MGVIAAIYKAKPSVQEDNETHSFLVTIDYDGKKFSGSSWCNSTDIEFYSSFVGYNIALSRARSNAMNYEYKKTVNELKARQVFLQEAIGYGQKNIADVDPTGSFQRGIKRLAARKEQIKIANYQEKDRLKKYLQGQDKAIESVKRFRNKDNNS